MFNNSNRKLSDIKSMRVFNRTLTATDLPIVLCIETRIMRDKHPLQTLQTLQFWNKSSVQQ